MEREEMKRQLISEGFLVVYEWRDEPGTLYPKHCHQDKVSFYVTSGSVAFTFDDGSQQTVTSGERFDVPVQLYHSAVVGDEGCEYVVGQMTEDDA